VSVADKKKLTACHLVAARSSCVCLCVSLSLSLFGRTRNSSRLQSAAGQKVGPVTPSVHCCLGVALLLALRGGLCPLKGAQTRTRRSHDNKKPSALRAACSVQCAVTAHCMHYHHALHCSLPLAPTAHWPAPVACTSEAPSAPPPPIHCAHRPAGQLKASSSKPRASGQRRLAPAWNRRDG